MSEQIAFLPIEDLIPHFVVSAFSQNDTQDWGLALVGIPEAHKVTRGQGITVAVLDTGAPDHLDVLKNLLPGVNCTTAPDAMDHQGHATHCSGIVAAALNGFGVLGIAPEAKILPIKVLGDNGQSGYDEITAGVLAATAAKVDIINMSLGAVVEPPQALHDAIIAATAKGIIIVAAAGNDAGAVNWPARYDEVIAVAAIDKNGDIAGFSSRGAQVAVGAPGVGIYSDFLNQQYALLTGTSQASPFVAGICALVLSYYRANPQEPQINNVQDMLQFLDAVSDPMGRVGCQGKQGSLGFGVPSFLNHTPWKSG